MNIGFSPVIKMVTLPMQYYTIAIILVAACSTMYAADNKNGPLSNSQVNVAPKIHKKPDEKKIQEVNKMLYNASCNNVFVPMPTGGTPQQEIAAYYHNAHLLLRAQQEKPWKDS